MAEQFNGHEDVWYESAPSFIGMHALGPLIDMSSEAPIPANGRRWYVSDHDLLFSSIGFEEEVRTDGLPADAPADIRAELSNYLDAWYTALPFSEAERGVVFDAYMSRSREIGSHRDVPGRLRKTEVEVFSAGVLTVVKGHDLMRRWWAWRRELDEFEGQGSLAQAKTALISFAGRLIRPEQMPDVFYDLQGGTRPVPYRHD